ncbi:helix-turn-helix transcriptional regulator [Aestuariivirga sp.]|uniref:helix-turn-helix transcriptional regulator n=1 Tax=Aestuariivirga sp. TaxID=2650926 RepID=UPI0039E51369
MDESRKYLLRAREKFDVLNLSYWFLGTSAQTPDRMTWLSTYDETYTSIYMRDFSPLGDPAFNICFSRQLPLDWAEVRASDNSVEEIHHVAESFGIGRQGISIPIRDEGFGHAMFSVNFECEDRHWGEMRQVLANGLHLFAHYFHQRVKDVISQRPLSGDFELSPREREVLKWAADGKTAWETAKVIGLSERAIRLYTENAMAKLRAKTKTQAVAIAVKTGLIN